ncbi:sporulation YhaL family protein [Oceanobacillus sp. APA_J-5(13-2)]|nr:sporulation YhaL family protein [Oceanobacillus alkalisoli]MCF3942026.1 sporulation YhaL family protein [Oceanobacillus alkalisoli]MCG5102021.1 sporulation YhaL family protein [Oceanobacillus alkalisoli]
MGGVPLWVFIVILLIFFSGYMAFRTMQADRKTDQEFIEREGEIYMERMREEKERKALREQE